MYMCSGLADVIYDFHAVIGTVPADRCSGKTAQKQQHIFPFLFHSLVWPRRVYETFSFFLFFSSVTKIQTTTTTTVIKQHDSNEALKL